MIWTIVITRLFRGSWLTPAGGSRGFRRGIHDVKSSAGLALTLLVLGVFANNHNFALALDDLALLAHGLDARSDFH